MAAILLALLGLVALATSLPSPTPTTAPTGAQSSTASSSPKPTTNQKPAAKVEQFLTDMVNKINKYRIMHAVQPLSLSLDLTNKAELWAVKLANKDQEELNGDTKIGQAIYSATKVDDIVDASVESWYNQIVHYKYYSPEPSPKNNYFIQLVWKDTTDIGIGKASSASGKTYIVAYFSPAAIHHKELMLTQVLPVTGSGVGKDGPSQCTEDYQFFNNSCYKLFPGPRTWESAVHKCTQQFASLASVDSDGENYLIKSLLTTHKKNFTWIGIGDHDDDKTFAWVDGTPNHFTKWDYGQAPPQGRQCVVVGESFDWKYIPCDKGYSFVCRRRLRDITTYEVIILYISKLWTDTLLNPLEPRYKALKNHIEESVFETYRDDDWFNSLVFKGFTKSNSDKILATIRISFTPDDDAPIDPIEKLRKKVSGSADSSNPQKRTIVRGVLFGEPVEIVNVSIVIEQPTAVECPGYCSFQSCQPSACNPSCCNPNGPYGSPQSSLGYAGSMSRLNQGYQGYPNQQNYQGYQGYPNQQSYQGYQGYPNQQTNSRYQGYPNQQTYPSYQGYGSYGYPQGYNQGYSAGNQNPSGYSGYPGLNPSVQNKPKPSEKKSKASKNNDEVATEEPAKQSKPQVKKPSAYQPSQPSQYNPYAQSNYPQYNQQYGSAYGQLQRSLNQYSPQYYVSRAPQQSATSYNPYMQQQQQQRHAQAYQQNQGYPNYQSYQGNQGHPGYQGYTNQQAVSGTVKKSTKQVAKNKQTKRPPRPNYRPATNNPLHRQGYAGYPPGYPSYGSTAGYTPQTLQQAGQQPYVSTNPFQVSGMYNGYHYSMQTQGGYGDKQACNGLCANSCEPQCPQQCCRRSHGRIRGR